MKSKKSAFEKLFSVLALNFLKLKKKKLLTKNE